MSDVSQRLQALLTKLESDRSLSAVSCYDKEIRTAVSVKGMEAWHAPRFRQGPSPRSRATPSCQEMKELTSSLREISAAWKRARGRWETLHRRRALHEARQADGTRRLHCDRSIPARERGEDGPRPGALRNMNAVKDVASTHQRHPLGSAEVLAGQDDSVLS